MQMNEHVWWYLSRSSGVVAWGLALASVVWGLLLSTRALGNKPSGPWLLDLHKHLSALTLGFLVVHVGSLAFDGYAPFTVKEMLVPMAAKWNPGAIAIGIVAMYLMVIVEVSSWVKKWLPSRVWHGLHLLSFVVYVLSTVHLFQAGTDVTNPWLYWTAMASVPLVLTLLGWRIGNVRMAKAEAARQAKRAAARAKRAEAQPATTAQPLPAPSTPPVVDAPPAPGPVPTPAPSPVAVASAAPDALAQAVEAAGEDRRARLAALKAARAAQAAEAEQPVPA